MTIVLDATTGITTPPIVVNSTTLGSATPGELEYDGKVPYFTPQGLQRGVMPGMQYYRLNSAQLGTNATGAQPLFGVGVSLSNSTVYAFEMLLYLNKTAGATSHTISIGFGGTSTNFGALWNGFTNYSSATSDGTGIRTGPVTVLGTSTSQIVSTAAITGAGSLFQTSVFGTVSINAGGTFIPQYSLSAAPGGAYSTQVGSYFLIYPIGAAGSNTSVGAWA